MRLLSLLFIAVIALPVHAELQLSRYSSNPDQIDEHSSLPVLIVESPHSYEKTVANLKRAISGRNYRLIREQKLQQGFVAAGTENNDLIIYFCNFSLVNEAVKKDRRIGQFLPCRITVIERNGKVYLMAMNPAAIGTVLENPELKATCNKVTAMYREILDEVTI